MKRSEHGEPLVKAVTLKIFQPGNRKSAKQVYRAPAGKGYAPEAVERILLRTANLIEKQLPTEEYHLVPIGPAAFNFVHAGRRAEEVA